VRLPRYIARTDARALPSRLNPSGLQRKLQRDASCAASRFLRARDVEAQAREMNMNIAELCVMPMNDDALGVDGR
jgi:hypothetical protein